MREPARFAGGVKRSCFGLFQWSKMTAELIQTSGLAAWAGSPERLEFAKSLVLTYQLQFTKMRI
jgi:hypothetical protein